MMLSPTKTNELSKSSTDFPTHMRPAFGHEKPAKFSNVVRKPRGGMTSHFKLFQKIICFGREQLALLTFSIGFLGPQRITSIQTRNYIKIIGGSINIQQDKVFSEYILGT